MNQAIYSAAGWVVVIFVGAVCGDILYRMWFAKTGKIDLSRLISEPNGDASLSHLQFLIFTVVISLSLFIITMGAKPAPEFPKNIPPEILTLLGISGSSYLVAKGIQFSNPAGLNRPALQLSPSHSTGAFPGKPIVLTVSLPTEAAGSTLPVIQWSLDAPADGRLLPSGNSATYWPPDSLPQNFKVMVRAQAAGFEDGLAEIS